MIGRVDRLPWLRMVGAVLLCAVILAPGHLATPDAHLRLAQARHLVDEGSLAVPEGVGDPDHGNLAPGRQGRLHSVYNPGHALLLTPIYWAAEKLPSPGVHPHYVAAFGASFLGVLAHLLTGLAVLVLAYRLGRSFRTSLMVAGLFAFATVSLPLAADGYDHVFEGLAILVSVCLLVEHDQGGEEGMPVAAGLVLGVGVLFRYSVLLALPGLLWIARGKWSKLRFLMGLAPSIFLMLCYNFYRFGSLFDTGYPAAWRMAHGTGIGHLGLQLAESPRHLMGLLVSPGKGLFWFSPVIALTVPCWVFFRRARPRIADGMLTIVVLYVLFYAANFAWHGSVWSWGPRYVTPALGPALVAIAYVPRERIWQLAVLGVGVLSVAVQVGAMTADHRRHLLEEYTRDETGFETRLLHDPAASPVVGQFESAAHVLRATFAGREYQAFIPRGPWRSVARPASMERMLQRSIDLNVVDLWWIRLNFLVERRGASLTGFLMAGLAFISFAWIQGTLWRGIPKA